MPRNQPNHSGRKASAEKAAVNTLLDSDLAALARLERRLDVVRDRVRGVALRHHTGAYIFGPPGAGKTHNVLAALDDLDVPYHHATGHLTPLGLFEVLGEHHDRVLVLDDVSQLLKQTTALQILLAALGKTRDATGARVLRYKRRKHEETVYFTGGLILLSNLELHLGALLQALKSRLHYLCYDPPDEELAALMRHLATKGWPGHAPKLTSPECSTVVEYLIDESQRLACRLDLRLLLEKAFPDYLLHRDGHARTHWKDLVTTTLEQAVRELRHTPPAESRDERLEHEYRIVREIFAECHSPKERLAAWRERTAGKKSARAFYRRSQELGLTG
jgi:hypothetical protein